MNAVREVLIRPGISPIPLSPEYLTGVTSFRGISLPIIELAPLLKLTTPADSTTSKHAGSRERIVVAQQEADVFGIRVDLLDRHDLSHTPNIPSLDSKLLYRLELPDEPPLHLLSLSELFKRAQGQMKPQLAHLS